MSTVARKYDIPNNILSTLIRNKDKIMKPYRKCGNAKHKRIRYLSN